MLCPLVKIYSMKHFSCRKTTAFVFKLSDNFIGFHCFKNRTSTSRSYYNQSRNSAGGVVNDRVFGDKTDWSFWKTSHKWGFQNFIYETMVVAQNLHTAAKSWTKRTFFALPLIGFFAIFPGISDEKLKVLLTFISILCRLKFSSSV